MCEEQFAGADNMTDAQAALACVLSMAPGKAAGGKAAGGKAATENELDAAKKRLLLVRFGLIKGIVSRIASSYASFTRTRILARAYSHARTVRLRTMQNSLPECRQAVRQALCQAMRQALRQAFVHGAWHHAC
jgi:hypothetical protein